MFRSVVYVLENVYFFHHNLVSLNLLLLEIEDITPPSDILQLRQGQLHSSIRFFKLEERFTISLSPLFYRKKKSTSRCLT